MKVAIARFAAVISLVVIACGSAGNRAGGEPYLLFDGERSFAELEAQVDFGFRVPGTDAHRACSEYLSGRLSEYADSIWNDRWEHVLSTGDTVALVNICASFNPGEKKRVLLCAHWDTRPIAEHDPDPASRDKPIPGANDGASGVAVLLELARVFSLAPPAAGVDIVLFDCEDYGDFHADTDVLIGSKRFAWEHGGHYRPALGVLLDLIGDRNARFTYEGYSWNYLPADCELIWETAEALGYGQIFAKQVGSGVTDDHVPLLRAGIRCIDIVQMGLPYWHTRADTPDKCSPSTLEAVGRTIAAVVYK
ncbi:MAG: M28 family peptidase [Gemmatimonadota bacterium]|nr:M28 family peptidase [Gemmatimonadota bacterium]